MEQNKQNYGEKMIDREEEREKEDYLGNDEDDIDSGESDEDLEDEDYDSSLKDDILRPASTRSKIVVNLREPRDQ